MLGKRVYIEMNYEGYNLSKTLNEENSNFEYTDNINSADEVSFTLHDYEKKWVNENCPLKGDKITAKLRVIENEKEEIFDCGEFYVDDYEFSFNPDTLNIKAISIDITSKLKSEEKTKIWEKTTLKALNYAIASQNKLTGEYKGKEIKFQRIEQKEESNGSLIQRMAISNGFSIKVMKSKLICLELSDLESKEATLTVKKGLIKPGSRIKSTDVETYDTCIIEYYDTKLAKKIKVEQSIERFGYKSPTGKVFKLNGNFGVVGNTKAEIEEQLKQVALGKLREKNRKELTMSFSVPGSFEYVAGRTCQIEGFGRFDKEKYFITQAKHKKSSSGYETSVEIRRCSK